MYEKGSIQTINLEDSPEDFSVANMPDTLPVLPIKNTVLFPGVVIPITVTRKKSIKLIKTAYNNNGLLGVVAQKSDSSEEPSSKDLYHVGAIARIIKMLVLPDGNTTIIIQGKNRFLIKSFESYRPYFRVDFEIYKEEDLDMTNHKEKALVQSIREAALKILKLNTEIPQEAQEALNSIRKSSFLIHFLSSNLNSKVEQKQELLETHKIVDRATLLLKHMLREIEMLKIKQEIQRKTHTDIDKQQRDYFLRQQIKTLQDELGAEGSEGEVINFRKQAKEKKWSKEVAVRFEKELDKLQRISPHAAEYPSTVNYIEFMLDLPWGFYTQDDFNLSSAATILDEHHFGLKKVKERILEYLATLKLRKDMKAPILCLYGPPGVGKTSLGASIAKALKRKYVRMSLGGVHDEAEIRGHRKTYIGAMPGKILQNIKKAKSSNPVFILDEIDKVQSGFNTGDPSSALLETLDPEQNNAFADNYLELDYDLSRTLFIATANSLDTINPALRDRMEILEISGYTLEEKEQIAMRHLVLKTLASHGMSNYNITFTREAIQKIIEGYTRESGVRELERKIGSVARNLAKAIVMKKKIPTNLLAKHVIKILATEIYNDEIYQGNDTAGVVTGLAWTRVGGDILFIESSLSKGKGKLTLSGQLGDVMKESAITALSFLKSRAPHLNIDYRVFQQYDLHVHVPAGAIPKDGPSAGIAMLTSLASVFTQRKVKARVAMTGEITLRGKILPVGGIKEKLLAAKRSGIKEIILSDDNRRDVLEIEKEYLQGLRFHFVTYADDLLVKALLKEKVRNPLSFDLDIHAKAISTIS